MKRTMPSWVKRFVRRSQSGQSILVLAIGFFALLGFVGIVTDVSLMFVRYTTLTRAIDAASIAAAGQVRRQVPFTSEIADHCSGVDPDGNPWTPDNPCNEAEAAAFARSYGNIGVAARQFIEFYGLNPQAVLIDTCFTVSTVDGDGNLVPIDPALADDFTELCEGPQGRNFERKLIKVTAQIESPTVFMRLLGFENFPLTASAISETAVLDVIVIMDVSESMLNQTTYDTWGAAGYGTIYVPPDVGWWKYYYDNNGTTSGVQGFGIVREHNFADMTGFVDYDDGYGGQWYRWRDTINNQLDSVYTYLNNNATVASSGEENPFYVAEFQHPSFAGTNTIATPCRVAYFPFSRNIAVPTAVQNLYDGAGYDWTEPNNRYSGFVPNYDYYRCCNDPNANGLFEDLICQPFLQARDATERFIKRIDFLRGDRIGFVTFDKTAFIMNIETPAGSNIYSHMIDNEADALNTVQQYMGVRAEPSFYEPTTLSGDRSDPADWVTAMPWIHYDDTAPNQWMHRSEALDPIHDYDVNQNCAFQDAAEIWPYSPSSSPSQTTATNYGIAATYDAHRYPNLLTPISFTSPPFNVQGQRMYPRSSTGVWESHPDYRAIVSYDLWASCRGTNIGAALREANNALLDPRTTRTNGSVWIMVLLSDGAAGASDPVYNTADGTVLEPDNASYIYDTVSLQQVKYGGLGVCPAGTSPAANAELTDFAESPVAFPFCSDEIPETRHFCFDPTLPPRIINGESVNLYVDLGAGECSDPVYYDVDDYARDWADWVGLAEPPYGGNIQRNASQLPTIFTIGFGLNFNGGTTKCETGSIAPGDVPDCLGEELLRYIADVGDNFRLDSDYQQALVTNRNPTIGSMSNADFGVRGECEDDLDDPATHTFAELISPSDAKLSCGNYYNAPSASELNRVFDDIASRMFTRLSS